jgi:hypothetical protein
MHDRRAATSAGISLSAGVMRIVPDDREKSEFLTPCRPKEMLSSGQQNDIHKRQTNVLRICDSHVCDMQLGSTLHV